MLRCGGELADRSVRATHGNESSAGAGVCRSEKGRTQRVLSGRYEMMEGNCERTFKQNSTGVMVDVARGLDRLVRKLAPVRGSCFAAGTSHAFDHDRQRWPAGDVRASWLHRV